MFQLVENYMPLRFREIPLSLMDYSFLIPCVCVCVCVFGGGGSVCVCVWGGGGGVRVRAGSLSNSGM